MPKNNLIFSNKMADIYFDSATKVLEIKYHGVVDYELFDDIIKVVNEKALEEGIVGVLVDLSQLAGSFHRLLEYMEKVGFPLLVDQGLRIQAKIISDDIMMNNLSNKVSDMMRSLGVEVKSFHNRNEAQLWLSNKLAELKTNKN